MRVSKLSVLSVLFFYLFALSAPLSMAWAENGSGGDPYYEDSIDDDSADVEEDDGEGMSTPEIIGAVLGGVVGLAIGLPIGPLGIFGGGLVGILLGKWIGQKLDEKSLGDRASDTWDDTKDRLRGDRFPGKEWWRNRWDSTKDWWNSDDFAGKYWWKERWEDIKFWQHDDEDDDEDPSAPMSSDLSAAFAEYRAALDAYQQALANQTGADLETARANFDKAAKLYFKAKRAAE